MCLVLHIQGLTADASGAICPWSHPGLATGVLSSMDRTLKFWISLPGLWEELDY